MGIQPAEFRGALLHIHMSTVSSLILGILQAIPQSSASVEAQVVDHAIFPHTVEVSASGALTLDWDGVHRPKSSNEQAASSARQRRSLILTAPASVVRAEAAYLLQQSEVSISDGKEKNFPLTVSLDEVHRLQSGKNKPSVNHGNLPLRAFLFTTIFNLSFVFLVFMAFLIAHRCCPIVYQRQEDKKSHSLTWTLPDINSTIQFAGLDGAMLLELHTLGAHLFALLGPVLLAVLLPLHMLGGDPESGNWLTKMNIHHLAKHSQFCWVHVVLVWFVVVTTLFLIQKSHQRIGQQKVLWEKSLPKPRGTTLMICDLPETCRSDSALKEHFMKVLDSADAVERAYVVRNSPTCTEETLAAEKARVAKAISENDPSIYSTVGFVTFASMGWLYAAQHDAHAAGAAGTCGTMEAAPEPQDVRYDDLIRTPQEHRVRQQIGHMCLVLLFIFWLPIVTIISGFINLDGLKRRWHAMKILCEEHPSLAASIQGILATLALSIFMSFLPAILLLIIESLCSPKSGANAQLALQRWYYAFHMIFILGLTLLTICLVEAIASWKHPGQALQLVGLSMPHASQFYLAWVFFAWVPMAMQLLRISNLIQFVFYRYLGYSLEKAKECSEPEDISTYGIGARMAMGTFYIVIPMVFCLCYPPLCIAAYILCILSRSTHSFLLKVETRKADLGGLFFMKSLTDLLFGLVIFVVLMVCVLASDSPGHFPPLVTSFAAVPVVVQYYRLRSHTQNMPPGREVPEADAMAEQQSSKYAGEYQQVSCRFA